MRPRPQAVRHSSGGDIVGVAKFKAAYAWCQALDGKSTARYREKALRFVPTPPAPDVPRDFEGVSDLLVDFMDRFTVEQMLACGW